MNADSSGCGTASRPAVASALAEAPCKINLFLFITGRLSNGYHELSTLFVRLPGPADRLTFSLGGEGRAGCRVICDAPGIDLENNTLTRAWRLYAEAAGWGTPLTVRLEKRIPSGAGLGGGSSDAAEVLRFLQRNAPAPLPDGVLMGVAARIGADVPFFLRDGACRASGIGDVLSPVRAGLEGMHCLLLCPPVHVSTPWAYAAWDAESRPFSLTVPEKTDKDNRSSYRCFYGMNDFESVVFAAHPELAELKARLLDAGAAFAGMSGSGSSIFGMFEDGAEAALAASGCLKAFPGVCTFGPFAL